MNKTHVLLACPKFSDSPPELIDEEDAGYMNIDLSDFPDGTIGDRIICTRDGVEKQGRLANVTLDPSRTQITCTIKCDDQKITQTTREFVKFDGEVDA